MLGVKNSFFYFVFISIIFMPHSLYAVFTIHEAYKSLKQNGYKWKQTEFLSLQAEAEKQQAKAPLYIHANLASREYFARINQMQYGLPDPGPLGIVTLGATTLQFAYYVYDQASLSRLKAAEENQNATNQTVIQHRQDLIYATFLMFLNTQRLRAKKQSVEESLSRDKKILEVAKARLNIGAGLKIDVLRALSMLEKDNLKKIETEFSLRKSRQELATIIGLENIDSEIKALKLKKAINASEPLMSAEEILKKPDILNAKYMASAAFMYKEFYERERGIKVLVAGDVGVFGTHVLGGVGNAITGSLGIQLSIPVLDGGYYSAKIQEYSSKHQIAEIQVRQLEAETKSQSELSHKQLGDAAQALEASLNYKIVAQEELQIVNKKYASGASSGLELSNAHANLAYACDTETEAIFAYEVAKLNYFKIRGRVEEYLTLEMETYE